MGIDLGFLFTKFCQILKKKDFNLRELVRSWCVCVKLMYYLELLDQGKSNTQIATQVKIGVMTVNRIRKKERPSILKAKGGRPSKLSEAARRRIRREITSGKAESAAKVSKILKNDGIADVSPDTVERALKKMGMNAITKVKKPLLTRKHKQKRFEFARTYKEWTVEDWKRVIWSDETKINRYGSDGRKWVWKKPGTPTMDLHVRKTVKHGGGGLMMWGCMTSKGVGYSCRIDGTMDAKLYTSILKDELLPTLDYYQMGKEDIIFQQDNDPKHTSKRMKSNS
eukprot:TRINITY_DN2199_c0_g1_i2.p1 TRINITY_DN2199_c0_g1~~TRINITY_DN2199_c0_g1_i2.p1  ORF type:complete len:282 (-),score=34.38 TRINITY_DN2199_c0_g1_i2:166-1011(-)